MDEMIPTSGSSVPSTPTVSIMLHMMFCSSGRYIVTIESRFRHVLTSLSNRNVMVRCSAITVDRETRSTLIMAFFLKRFSSVLRRKRRCTIILGLGHAADVSGICIKIRLDIRLERNPGRGNFVIRVLERNVLEGDDSVYLRNQSTVKHVKVVYQWYLWHKFVVFTVNVQNKYICDLYLPMNGPTASNSRRLWKLICYACSFDLWDSLEITSQCLIR